MKRKFLRFLNDLDVGLIGADDAESAGKIRGHQIDSVGKTSVTTLVGMLACAAIIYLLMDNKLIEQQLLLWLAVTWLMGGYGLWTLYVRRRRKRLANSNVARTASRQKYRRVIREVATFSILWAMLPMLTYPHVGVAEQGVVLAVMTGVMGGGVLSFYIIPRAMLIWLTFTAIGSGAALLLEGSVTSFGVLGLLIVYSAALIQRGLLMARTFADAHLAKIEVSEQSETIGILLREFSENTRDWLWEFSADGKVMLGRQQFENALGVSFGNVKAESAELPNIASGEVSLNWRSLELLQAALERNSGFRDIVIQAKGIDCNNWVSLSGKPILDSSGKITGFRGVASNITRRKQDEERIAYLAHNDALTGLVNRENFSIALQEKYNTQNLNNSWAILYLDLDGFKSVNDQEGHHTGDKLLVAVASRLKTLVSDRDIVARLGGDEFAILCNSATTVQSLSKLAEELIKELSKPYAIEQLSLDVGVSIGVAIGPKDGKDPYTLMNNADLALYRAKAEGKGTFRLYELEMDEIVKERRSLENDLREALRNEELSVSYQPLICAKDGKTSGFEALARWSHPERGEISPSDFIPIAEGLGIIPAIGKWVLTQACCAAAEWPEHLTVAVNLSPQQFQSRQIVSDVVEALKISKLKPSRLELEITEGLFMENTDEVLFVLRELKGMGIGIAMDDFGTGYSSLSYIMKFPFDKLKIDRSFILSLEDDGVGRNVLEVITKLGDVLNLSVTAEGVETMEQLEMLQGMNCTHYQGYYFGEAFAQEEMAAYLVNELNTDLISYRRDYVDAAIAS